MGYCKWIGLIIAFGIFTESALTSETLNSKPLTGKKLCTVNREPPSEAQKALDREEYEKAEALFRQRLTANPDDEQARTGVIRVLIEENKVDDAQASADAFLKGHPENSAALEAMGEVRFRRGELQTAYDLAIKAVNADPCNARAYLFQSAFEALVAMHAMSRNHRMTAYKLDPEDKVIQAAWISELPHDEQIKAWAEFTSHSERFSEKALTEWKEYLAHAQDYKPDDCRMVSGMPIDKDVSVPLTRIPYSYFAWGLDVELNGKVKQLEVDTSTNGLVLSKRVAASLGLVPGQKVVGAGIGSKGLVNGWVTQIDSVKIGKMEFRNCNVLVLDKESASNDLEGKIGSNIFAKYLLTLDFPAQRLRVGSLPKRPENAARATALGLTPEAAEGNGPRDRYIAPEMQNWSNIYREGRSLLLPTSIGGTSSKLFLIHTGDSNMISTTAAREVTKLSKDPTGMLYTSKGPDKHVMMTGQFTWVFAGIAQKTDRMTAADFSDMSHNYGMEISGYIGSPILSMLVMHIDYRDNLVKFEYHP